VPKSTPDANAETTYSLGVASRLTGLSGEVLRAWERRYGAVQPPRTPGGTRRYRERDLERLRLLKAAVDAGHRIGDVARLDDDELARRASRTRDNGGAALEEVLGALSRYRGADAQRLLAIQLAALGAVRFATEIALPLVREIGDRWASGRMTVASEHLASGILRSLFGSSLQPSASSLMGPRIVFATPSGERHELGLQMAALTAMGAGAAPIYLGADLPVDEMLHAAERSDARVLALSLVTIARADATRVVRELRRRLAPRVRIWLGGAAAPSLPAIDGVECIRSLEACEARVARLGYEAQ
jgi:DNA-binding transcriptional MerR regulator/methylmalonyl-CoA mutase cobalamin-binding subunit